MDAIVEFAALCRQGVTGLAILPASLPLTLFVAGLAGSLVHCVGMCGPFVLGQVSTDAGRTTGGYGEWQRLGGASLAPYHLGRLTTYTALGSVAGAVTALFAASTGFGWLSAVLLALAALLMILQAFGLALGTASPWSGLVTGLVGPLALSQQPAGRYALGLVLGFLPCGLLYGALAAAAGTGSASEGAISMAAFGLGTIPALVGVGWLGVVLRRRLRGITRWIAAPLLVFNAFALLALASQRL
ncbi:sulfite exporter TauE/SafE family protein [soil metagenome]